MNDFWGNRRIAIKLRAQMLIMQNWSHDVLCRTTEQQHGKKPTEKRLRTRTSAKSYCFCDINRHTFYCDTLLPLGFIAAAVRKIWISEDPRFTLRFVVYFGAERTLLRWYLALRFECPISQRRLILHSCSLIVEAFQNIENSSECWIT